MKEDLMWQLRSQLLIACANRGYSALKTIACLTLLEQGRAEDLETLRRLGLILKRKDDEHD